MKSRKWAVFFSLLAAALPFVGRAADNHLTKAEKKDGWVLLFDGKTLEGWKGNPDLWRVQDGAIVGRIENNLGYNTFLCTQGEFADFTLKFQCLLVKNFGNSGVQYRSRVIDPAKYIVQGYQADMAEKYWGMLYEERARGILVPATDAGKEAVKKDQWNDFEISASGFHLKQIFNGVVTVDWEDADTAKRSDKGIIALQYHAGYPGMDVRFKNIKLKKIETAK